MIYSRPFTPEQRREAVREYQSFRNNVRHVRKAFPAITTAERKAFRRYRDHVQAIGAELLRIDSRVRVDELNAQIELSRVAMAEYLRVKYFG